MLHHNVEQSFHQLAIAVKSPIVDLLKTAIVDFLDDRSELFELLVLLDVLRETGLGDFHEVRNLGLARHGVHPHVVQRSDSVCIAVCEGVKIAQHGVDSLRMIVREINGAVAFLLRLVTIVGVW